MMTILCDIRCPCCNKKLMCVRLDNKTSLAVVVINNPSQQNDYTIATRCHVCKSYVGCVIA